MKKIFLNLLKQPITNSYLTKVNNRVIKKEFFYNLSVVYNSNNHLVSLSKPVNPKMQFTDKYAHRASESLTMLKSFKKISKTLKRRFKPKKALEIGSNDGVFLKNFKKKEIIAVEPCLNLARISWEVNNEVWLFGVHHTKMHIFQVQKSFVNRRTNVSRL